MRKLSLVVAAVVALGLALAPTASADLVSAVQQQLSQSGGRLPTDPAAQQTFVSGLVSSARWIRRIHEREQMEAITATPTSAWATADSPPAATAGISPPGASHRFESIPRSRNCKVEADAAEIADR